MYNGNRITANDIYENNFKIDTKGYRMKEFDEFLDLIIENIDAYEKEIEALTLNNNNLAIQISDLKKEIRDLEMKLEISDASAIKKKEVTNVDLLKRLARLEKVVYNSEDM